MITPAYNTYRAVIVPLKKHNGATWRVKVSIEVATHVIIEQTYNYYGVYPESRFVKTRKRTFITPKQVATWMLHHYLSPRITLKKISGNFGREDHSNAIHAINSVNDMAFTDPKYRKDIHNLKAIIEKHIC